LRGDFVKKVRRLVLVLGDQLNFDSAAFDDLDANRDAVLMIEARHEATYVPQHKQRPVLFFSAMRHFRDELRERGFTVHYAALDSKHNRGSFREEVPRWVQKTHAETLVVAQPGDYRVQAELRGRCGARTAHSTSAPTAISCAPKSSSRSSRRACSSRSGPRKSRRSSMS
jgi:deoxyribodipyrimidine photolyase-like uncharacterized protein